jgi:hypothetical protein
MVSFMFAVQINNTWMRSDPWVKLLNLWHIKWNV